MQKKVYVEAASCCSKEWLEIAYLEQKERLTEEEMVKLDQLKTRFNLVLSADF